MRVSCGTDKPAPRRSFFPCAPLAGPPNYQSSSQTSWSWRPATCQNRRLKLSTIKGALQCDIARSRMDVRFRGKSGRAADITGMTESDPLRKFGGPKCCDAQHVFSNDVEGCDTRRRKAHESSRV